MGSGIMISRLIRAFAARNSKTIWDSSDIFINIYIMVLRAGFNWIRLEGPTNYR